MKRSYIYSLIIFLLGIVSLFSGEYKYLVFTLIALLVIMLLDNLGKGIVLREVVAIFYCFTCLLMPWIGYEYFGITNPLSAKWVKYMKVDQYSYFNYAFPAICFFCLMITFPLSGKNEADKEVSLKRSISQIKKALQQNLNIGLVIMLAGSLISLLTNYLPETFQFISTLCFFSSFAGMLYVFFAPSFKWKTVILTLFIIFNIANALATGMFTLVVYMGLTIFSFFYIGRRTSLVMKIAAFVAGVFFILVLQNTKVKYRYYTWKMAYKEDKTMLFAEIFWDNIKKGEALMDPMSSFLVYSRSNQGFYVSMVMKRIPQIVPFDDGQKLIKSFFASLVPRFLWPDKPKAGGLENMYYYTGLRIRGYSVNVGPLGEAYGSFGVMGGILYMTFLGFVIRLIYAFLFDFARVTPVLILWLPVVFFQTTYSAETDTMQILNSLLKSSLFIFILYRFFPIIFLKKSDQKNLLLNNRNLHVFSQEIH